MAASTASTAATHAPDLPRRGGDLAHDLAGLPVDRDAHRPLGARVHGDPQRQQHELDALHLHPALRGQLPVGVAGQVLGGDDLLLQGRQLLARDLLGLGVGHRGDLGLDPGGERGGEGQRAPQVEGLERVALGLGQAAGRAHQVVEPAAGVGAAQGEPLRLADLPGTGHGLAVDRGRVGLGPVPVHPDAAAVLGARHGVVGVERHEDVAQLLGAGRAAQGLGGHPAPGQPRPEQAPGPVAVEFEGHYPVHRLPSGLGVHERRVTERAVRGHHVLGQLDGGPAL